MFFAKRECNPARRASRCADDNAFLLPLDGGCIGLRFPRFATFAPAEVACRVFQRRTALPCATIDCCRPSNFMPLARRCGRWAFRREGGKYSTRRHPLETTSLLP